MGVERREKKEEANEKKRDTKDGLVSLANPIGKSMKPSEVNSPCRPQRMSLRYLMDIIQSVLAY
jgi:hypothetical protein